MTDSQDSSVKLQLTPENPQALANTCGPLEQHIKQIEQRLSVRINNRGYEFVFSGNPAETSAARSIIKNLYSEALKDITITADMVHLLLQEAGASHLPGTSEGAGDVVIRTHKLQIRPRGGNQQNYVRSIRRHDVNFGIGPAGTGKTYLAVACAVEALEREEVSRILLVRPAVEAGEKLGFLPGDLAQKVDPYLRPLYDALYDMMGFERVAKLLERNVIEVAPLAYMRGRTLNGSFVILDESQNTTREQMKMFLTRIGFGSTAVITGDATQVDLPRGTKSGLLHATEVLRGVEGIGFTQFLAEDVVRHPLVQHIVQAYERFEAREAKAEKSAREKKD